MVFAPDEAPIRGKTVERGQSRHLSEAGDVPKATACWGAMAGIMSTLAGFRDVLEIRTSMWP